MNDCFISVLIKIVWKVMNTWIYEKSAFSSGIPIRRRRIDRIYLYLWWVMGCSGIMVMLLHRPCPNPYPTESHYQRKALFFAQLFFFQRFYGVMSTTKSLSLFCYILFQDIIKRGSPQIIFLYYLWSIGFNINTFSVIKWANLLLFLIFESIIFRQAHTWDCR